MPYQYETYTCRTKSYRISHLVKENFRFLESQMPYVTYGMCYIFCKNRRFFRDNDFQIFQREAKQLIMKRESFCHIPCQRETLLVDQRRLLDYLGYSYCFNSCDIEVTVTRLKQVILRVSLIHFWQSLLPIYMFKVYQTQSKTSLSSVIYLNRSLCLHLTKYQLLKKTRWKG